MLHLQAESCIILRPFINKLTKSELHAVMTGGFATVAGSYIALLVEVGVSPLLYFILQTLRIMQIDITTQELF